MIQFTSIVSFFVLLQIQVYGRHVFMGYLNDPQKTLGAIDDEGWLYTGDIGKIDIDGFLTVRDRISGMKL